MLLLFLAAQDVRAEIQSCAGTADSLARLNCFDALAKRLGPPALTAGNGKIEKPATDGSWTITEQANPLDDTRSAYATLKSDEQNALLVLRCVSKKPEVMMMWGKYLGSDAIPVTARLDAAKAEDDRWGLSTDHTAAFHPNASKFIGRLRGASRLVTQVVPYSESPITSTFDLTGVPAAADAVALRCRP
ncbi:MAG TPA: hypothetical protein VJ735_05945 [Actinomycetes bacterium]|nr:hypothetical protein [Actinomycetes bacterium]